MNQPYARVNQPYATLTLASPLREMFGVQLYKNNARALLLRILSILNLDWLQHARSVRGVYEWVIKTLSQGYQIEFIGQLPISRDILSTRLYPQTLLPESTYRGSRFFTTKRYYRIIIKERRTAGLLQSNICDPKEGGGMRTTLNVKPLNKLARKLKFKMPPGGTCIQRWILCSSLVPKIDPKLGFWVDSESHL